jgi:polar amino acid transport system ATP-binding protein
VISVRAARLLRDRVPILDDLHLDAPRGQITALVGASGGGKSTLLRCIVGLAPLDGGEIQVGDLLLGTTPLPEAQLRALRRRVGLIFQQYHLFPHLSVLDNLTLAPLRSLGLPRSIVERRAREQLGRVGLLDRAQARPDQLSGGQQQRAALARALMVEPEALLLDEPTSALDPAATQSLAELFGRLAADGLALLLVSHAMPLVQRVAHQVHVLHQGRIVERGGPALLTSPQHPATRQLMGLP